MWLLGRRGKLTIALLSAIFWLRLSSYSLRPRFVCGLLLRVLVGAVIGSILHGSRDIDNSRCCEYQIKVKNYGKKWSVNLTLEWEGWLNNCSTGSITVSLTHTPWPSLNKIGAHTTHDNILIVLHNHMCSSFSRQHGGHNQLQMPIYKLIHLVIPICGLQQ